MRTQVKCFKLNSLDELETVVNTWMATKEEFVFQGLHLIPAVNNGAQITLVMIVYASDNWRSGGFPE